MCVISLSLKMWTVSNNVGRVLEYVGMAEKNDPLRDYAHMIGVVIVCFFSLQMCMLVNNFMISTCRYIVEAILMNLPMCMVVKNYIVSSHLLVFETVLTKVRNFLSPPPFVPPFEPLVYPFEVMWTESFEHPSEESHAEMESVVNRAEEICEESGRDIPEEYLCPIGRTVMVTPVMTLTGHTFDLKHLQKWLECNNTCPKTREPTKIANRNWTVEHIIQKWAKDVIDKRIEDVLTPAPVIVEPHTETDDEYDEKYAYIDENDCAELFEDDQNPELEARIREEMRSFMQMEAVSNGLNCMRAAVAGSDDDDW